MTWGLRDYGTGTWTGGDPGCDHMAPPTGGPNPERYTPGGGEMFRAANDKQYERICGKCGAQRVDQQLGLEPTPDEYVANMVAVFREVRRVLADHGTCWLNLGDSYAGSWGAQSRGENSQLADRSVSSQQILAAPKRVNTGSWVKNDPVVKPKDLVGIPWRVAFALQADGWYLRADIIWAKPNPMPESVTDRPTKAHEYVFMLSKRSRYHFDQEAVREPATPDGIAREGRSRLTAYEAPGQSANRRSTSNGEWLSAGRNVRSVWEIPTQPYAEAHFATYPEELVRRCVLAGCPVRVCVTCGLPSERIVDVSPMEIDRSDRTHELGHTRSSGTMTKPREATTVGWSDCGHNTWRPGTVLDPFLGSGTTALVARKHGRRCVGIELNGDYAAMIAARTRQLSLLG